MLRESSKHNGETVDLQAVMDGTMPSGIPHGERLVAFAEAVVGRDSATIASAREALVDAAGTQAMVDAAGVISNFQRMVRIADSTGIGLGDFDAPTAELRQTLGIDAFQRSAR